MEVERLKLDLLSRLLLISRQQLPSVLVTIRIPLVAIPCILCVPQRQMKMIGVGPNYLHPLQQFNSTHTRHKRPMRTIIISSTTTTSLLLQLVDPTKIFN